MEIKKLFSISVVSQDKTNRAKHNEVEEKWERIQTAGLVRHCDRLPGKITGLCRDVYDQEGGPALS